MYYNLTPILERKQTSNEMSSPFQTPAFPSSDCSTSPYRGALVGHVQTASNENSHTLFSVTSLTDEARSSYPTPKKATVAKRLVLLDDDGGNIDSSESDSSQSNNGGDGWCTQQQPRVSTAELNETTQSYSCDEDEVPLQAHLKSTNGQFKRIEICATVDSFEDFRLKELGFNTKQKHRSKKTIDEGEKKLPTKITYKGNSYVDDCSVEVTTTIIDDEKEDGEYTIGVKIRGVHGAIEKIPTRGFSASIYARLVVLLEKGYLPDETL
jgi:hypothetical protein